jgi:Flp pilus assembly protein CpaB
MKPKTMILMAVAIVCGLGASYMTSRLLADREEAPPAAEPPPERVTFLVAKVNLDHGAALKNPQEMFVEKSANKDDAPKDTVTELKVLKGKFLKRGLRKGDHITSEDLVDEKTSILANLPDGYQAYGIQVDPASIAAGWASLPGSKVNILWTMRGGDNKSSFSKLLLEDVLVLAADGQSIRIDEGKAMPAQVVTVALKTTDTMKVKLAQLYGPLTLTLRKYGDTAPPPEEMVFQGEELFKTGLPSKNDKKRLVGSNSSETPEGSSLDNVPVIPKTAEAKKDKKQVIQEEDTPPPPKRYYHVVNFRQGDKQWRQVIEVDVQGLPIQDDVQRDGQDQVQQTPAVQSQPAPQQRPQSAGNKK